jgi:hypothetical protein
MYLSENTTLEQEICSYNIRNVVVVVAIIRIRDVDMYRPITYNILPAVGYVLTCSSSQR